MTYTVLYTKQTKIWIWVFFLNDCGVFLWYMYACSKIKIFSNDNTLCEIHGSCIHHLRLDICLHECNYPDSPRHFSQRELAIFYLMTILFSSMICNDLAISIVRYEVEKYTRTGVLSSSSFVSPVRMVALASPSWFCSFPMFSVAPPLSTVSYVRSSFVTSVTVLTFSPPVPAAWSVVCNYEVVVSNGNQFYSIWTLEPEVVFLLQIQVRPQSFVSFFFLPPATFD